MFIVMPIPVRLVNIDSIIHSISINNNNDSEKTKTKLNANAKKFVPNGFVHENKNIYRKLNMTQCTQTK